MTRLGAVDYLNVRPLVHGLVRFPDLVTLRFDSPAECARLLDAGEIDLGMVPSITHLARPSDRIVPGMCIGSDGPVDSVALFLRGPIRDVRTLAVDTSSRTSVALTRILCARRFGIQQTCMLGGTFAFAARAEYGKIRSIANLLVFCVVRNFRSVDRAKHPGSGIASV